jgi:hypothetical protein
MQRGKVIFYNSNNMKNGYLVFLVIKTTCRFLGVHIYPAVFIKINQQKTKECV